MGYTVKIQKVERPTNRTYYVNLPVVIVEAINLEKGELLEWLIENKNTLVLQRVKTKSQKKLRSVKS